MSEDKMLEFIEEQVLIFFDHSYDKTALWMNTKNLNFGGASPNELIRKGKIKRVYNFIKNALEGNIA